MRQKGLEIEHRYDRESHVKHCHMAFTAITPLDVINTKVAVGLGGNRVGGVRNTEQTKAQYVKTAEMTHMEGHKHLHQNPH